MCTCGHSIEWHENGTGKCKFPGCQSSGTGACRKFHPTGSFFPALLPISLALLAYVLLLAAGENKHPRKFCELCGEEKDVVSFHNCADCGQTACGSCVNAYGFHVVLCTACKEKRRRAQRQAS